jgi:hypothetical protein
MQPPCFSQKHCQHSPIKESRLHKQCSLLRQSQLSVPLLLALLGILLLLVNLKPNSVQAVVDFQARGSEKNSSKLSQAAESQTVTFSNNANTTVTIWSINEIAAQVPLDTSSGTVFVTAVHGDSNPISFTIGSSSVPHPSGQAATWTTELGGGAINVDTVWDTDILIKGDITVAANTTLTVTPGVTIFFTAGSDDQASGTWTDRAEIHVHGKMVAEGTPASPIYFVSNAAAPAVGDWGQIALRKDSDTSVSHCVVRHAETGIHFISYNEGGGVLTGTVQNCLVSDNRIGIDLYGKPGHPFGGTVTINPKIANNHIKNNLEYGVRVEGASGYGNVDITMMLQNNVIAGNDYGVFLKGGSSWWEGHVNQYTTVQGNTIRDNTSMGIHIKAIGSNDSSGSDTDVQPLVQYNLLANNGTNIHLLLDPQGSDGTQILNPTIQYNSILSATNGILIEDNQAYDTLVPVIQNNVFFGYEAAGDYAINNQTNRTIIVKDDYWGDEAAEWDAGPQAGDEITGTVTVNSYQDSGNKPLLSHLTPAQAEAGAEVKLYGANFGEALVPPVFSVNLPFIIKAYRFDPITINYPAIPARSVSMVGEVFYSTTIFVGANLPTSGTFYLSSAADAPIAASVDDEVALLLNSTELFTHRYGQPALGVKPALVEIPRSVMEQIAGKTTNVIFRDVYGDKVSASVLYLIWVP